MPNIHVPDPSTGFLPDTPLAGAAPAVPQVATVRLQPPGLRLTNDLV